MHVSLAPSMSLVIVTKCAKQINFNISSNIPLRGYMTQAGNISQTGDILHLRHVDQSYHIFATQNYSYERDFATEKSKSSER